MAEVPIEQVSKRIRRMCFLQGYRRGQEDMRERAANHVERFQIDLARVLAKEIRDFVIKDSPDD